MDFAILSISSDLSIHYKVRWVVLWSVPRLEIHDERELHSGVYATTTC